MAHEGSAATVTTQVKYRVICGDGQVRGYDYDTKPPVASLDRDGCGPHAIEKRTNHDRDDRVGASMSADDSAVQHTIPVYDRVLHSAVKCALHVYRTTDDIRMRAAAASVLRSLPAWMQQDEFRPPAAAACSACGGTGVGGYVNREMATDAGEPSMEGMPEPCPLGCPMPRPIRELGPF